MLLLRCLHKANIDERIEKTPINESWILITFSGKEIKLTASLSLKTENLGYIVIIPKLNQLTLILPVLNKMSYVLFGCYTASHTPYHYQLSHIDY